VLVGICDEKVQFLVDRVVYSENQLQTIMVLIMIMIMGNQFWDIIIGSN
jgi:hypothetical protein